jgi:hypothetical protein
MPENNKAKEVREFIAAGLALLIGTLFYGFFGWLACMCFGVVTSLGGSMVTAFIATFFQVWISLGNTEKLQAKINSETSDLPPDDEPPSES